MNEVTMDQILSPATQTRLQNWDWILFFGFLAGEFLRRSLQTDSGLTSPHVLNEKDQTCELEG
jgi:hypothetical protein